MFTRCHNPDDYNLLHLRCENLKSGKRTDLVISICEDELLSLFVVFIRNLYRVEQLSITAFRPTLLRLCDSDAPSRTPITVPEEYTYTNYSF